MARNMNLSGSTSVVLQRSPYTSSDPINRDQGINDYFVLMVLILRLSLMRSNSFISLMSVITLCVLVILSIPTHQENMTV